MEVRAKEKTLPVSTKNLRLITREVQGMQVDDALDVLRFIPTPLAKIVHKAVHSAAANAENNFQMSRDVLCIAKIYADQGPTLKRFRASARGRISPIQRRTCHLTVVVDERRI